MINIGNKEITSIYCGKNAVNGIYCGQTLIWPTTISNDEWLTGSIIDSQGQEFSAVFTKEYDDENEIDFNLTMLNGMEVGTSSPLFFSIYCSADSDDKWQIMFKRNGQYVGNYDANTTGRDTKNFNFTIDIGGMTMNFNLTRTSIDPTI